MAKYVVRLSEVSAVDVLLVGGKGAQLGEMVKADLPVPDGFIVTTTAYDFFLEFSDLRTQIGTLLANLNTNDSTGLKALSSQIKGLIEQAIIPAEIEQEIRAGYAQLAGSEVDLAVAVRSSATSEDLPGASFAGQQSTFLNIQGEGAVLRAVQRCWASLFESRAIYYRADKGFDHLETKMAVPIQRMIQSEKSGILFTADPITGDREKLVIEAAFGLGEPIVSGQITPDHYIVNKTTLVIENREIGKQAFKLVQRPALQTNPVHPIRDTQTVEVSVSSPVRTDSAFVITEAEANDVLTTPVPLENEPLTTIPGMVVPPSELPQQTLTPAVESQPLGTSPAPEVYVSPLTMPEPVVPPVSLENTASPVQSEPTKVVGTATPEDTFVIKEADLQADLDAIRQAYADAKAHKTTNSATLTRTGQSSVTLTFTGEPSSLSSQADMATNTVESLPNSGESDNIRMDLSDEVSSQPKLTDEEILELARLGLSIESRYQQPQDIEWAIADGKIFVLQTRPITTVDMSPAPELAQAITPAITQVADPTPELAPLPLPQTLQADPPAVIESVATVLNASNEATAAEPRHYLNIDVPAAAYQLSTAEVTESEGIIINVPALTRLLYGIPVTEALDIDPLPIGPLQTFLVDLLRSAKKLGLQTALVMASLRLEPEVIGAIIDAGVDIISTSPELTKTT